MDYKTKLVLIVLCLIIYLIYSKREHNVSNRDMLGEVLLTGRVEIPKNIIKFSGGPVSFKLSDNKVSSGLL